MMFISLKGRVAQMPFNPVLNLAFSNSKAGYCVSGCFPEARALLLCFPVAVRCTHQMEVGSECSSRRFRLLPPVTSGLGINLPVPSVPQEPGLWRLCRFALPPNGALCISSLTFRLELLLDTHMRFCFADYCTFESKRRTVESSPEQLLLNKFSRWFCTWYTSWVPDCDCSSCVLSSQDPSAQIQLWRWLRWVSSNQKYSVANETIFELS